METLIINLHESRESHVGCVCAIIVDWFSLHIFYVRRPLNKVRLYDNDICVIPEYVFAALPRTQRGTPLVLGGDPKGKKFLYTNGNSVIIRDIENPAIADVYTEHSCQVNVAKYSPSGFYIASGGKHKFFIDIIIVIQLMSHRRPSTAD